MKKTLLKVLFPAILVTISLFLCFKNHTPGTYLLGWDSIHSEFNFPLNVSRMLTRVWSGEQGVGAIAAHSDMSDLPRIILLWASLLILPQDFLRYFYIFLCLVLGPLGMYFFLKYVFNRPAAFLGGLFYLLNLGTLQNFYVPLEMFPTAFAATPWLFLTSLRFLKEGKRRNLLYFIPAVVFAMPMAYAATLSYATFAGLFMFLLVYGLFSAAKKVRLKRFFALLVLTLALNSFWILPNFYSLIKQSDVISNAQANRLFSPEAFLRNQEYGDFKDILIQKNFLFDWRNFDFQRGQFKDLLDVWINHIGNLPVLAVGYILAAASIAGFVIGIVRKEKVILAATPVLLFTLFFLFNANPPAGNFYSYLYNHFDVFREALRMPFTKFSILFEFLAALTFGYLALICLSTKSKLLVPIKLIFITGVLAGLIYWMLPAFNGDLIARNVRVSLPNEYNQLFDWFNKHSDGRVAFLPMNSKFNWEYRNWGYEGSGFLTYGIGNPMFYRDFDRWSKYNEDFYNEASNALYGDNPEAFLLTLKKYQVKYLLLDGSVINPGGSPISLSIPAGVKEVAKFGFLTVYETGFDLGQDFVSAPKTEIVNTLPALLKQGLAASEDLSVNRGFPGAYNCDLKKTGTVFKQNSGGGILYRADRGGVSCDFLNYPDLKYNRGYILHIAGENKKGRGLKIYFTNYATKRADLEELLPSGAFDEIFNIYPSKLDGTGYALNFETRSFGRIASENLVTKVEIYNAVPTGKAASGEDDVSNDLKILSIRKYGTWAYKVDVQGNGLIQLGQGYQSGWVALQLPITNFQFLILKHEKFNDWSNSWVVPSNQPTNQSTIYLIYWPQLLEWGGMFLGIIAFVVVWGPVGSSSRPTSSD